MTEIPSLGEGQKILQRLQNDPIIHKNFRLKVAQGLSYLSDTRATETTDLQLVSFQQTNPQFATPLAFSQLNPSPSQNGSKPSEAQSSGTNFCHELTGQPQWIWKTLPTRNHNIIFTCGGDKMIYKWTLTSHNYHIGNFGVHDGPIYDLCLNADETVLYSASKDRTVKAWRVEDGVLLKQIDFDFELFRLILNRNETRLIVGGVNGEICLVDLHSAVMDRLSGHNSVVRDLVLLKDGRTLVSCSQDKFITRWDINKLECLGANQGQGKEVFGLAFSLDQTRMYSAGNEDKVTIWNMSTMEVAGSVPLEGPAGSLALNSSGTRLYVGLQAGPIQVFEVGTWKEVERLTGFTDRVTSVWVAPNETLVIAGSKDKSVKFWEHNSVKKGIRNFNLNTKRGNLFSIDLSDEATLLKPVYYKPLNERPNGYTLNLTDELNNRLMTVNLKPISYQPKDDYELPEEKILVRLESVTEFELPVKDVLAQPDLFRNFVYTNRFDNQDHTTALTLQHLTRKDEVTIDQIKEAVSGFINEPADKPDLIRSLDAEGNIADQLQLLLNNFDDDFIAHDADYKSKMAAFVERVRLLEASHQKLTDFNDRLAAFVEEASNSIENLNEEIGKILDTDELRQGLTDFFFRIKAKNPFVDSVHIKGTLTRGVLNGYCTRVESDELVVKGEFRNGLLNGRGMRITKPSILSGWFKDGVLEKKPFVIYERNGIIRVADEFGEINKLIFRGITYMAKGISEIYEGPAFVSFPDGTCFTSVIKNLRLVGDIINRHLVFFYGPEQKSHFLVYDSSTKMLREDDRNVFQINWDTAKIIKL